MERDDTIEVEVAYAEPDVQLVVAVRVPADACAWEAIKLSGLAERFPGIEACEHGIGIFGEPVSPTTPLADGDRVEIYRPLEIDPKEARRLRAARAKSRPR